MLTDSKQIQNNKSEDLNKFCLTFNALNGSVEGGFELNKVQLKN